jgi:hypothetical protein
MHIVNYNNKKIYFVPRAFDLSVSVKITDEETNVSATESLTATIGGELPSYCTPSYTFVEGRYYTIKLQWLKRDI